MATSSAALLASASSSILGKRHFDTVAAAESPVLSPNPVVLEHAVARSPLKPLAPRGFSSASSPSSSSLDGRNTPSASGAEPFDTPRGAKRARSVISPVSSGSEVHNTSPSSASVTPCSAGPGGHACLMTDDEVDSTADPVDLLGAGEDLHPVTRAGLQLRGCVVEVEGCVGSGKSTLTRLIKTMIDSRLQDTGHGLGERVSGRVRDSFTSVFGEQVNQTFLGAFYQDTKRYGFAFQMFMLSSRLYQIDEASRQAKQENRLVFLDRGAVGDTLFALQNHRLGNLDAQDMEVYRSVCRQSLPDSLSEKVDVVLYLDVDPDECHHRMMALRQHQAEAGIPLDYVRGLDEGYFHLFMDWLSGRRGGFHDMNIGAAPPTAVLLWDRYGSPEQALECLAELRAGRRQSPEVAFSAEAPAIGPGAAHGADGVAGEHGQHDGDAGEVPQVISADDLVPVEPLDEHPEAQLMHRVLRLDTQAQVHRAYRLVVQPIRRRAPCPSGGGSPQVRLSHAPGHPRQTRLLLNWDLPHDNAFRRVAMFYLAVAGRVDCYGRTALHPEAGPQPAVQEQQ